MQCSTPADGPAISHDCVPGPPASLLLLSCSETSCSGVVMHAEHGTDMDTTTTQQQQEQKRWVTCRCGDSLASRCMLLKHPHHNKESSQYLSIFTCCGMSLCEPVITTQRNCCGCVYLPCSVQGFVKVPKRTHGHAVRTAAPNRCVAVALSPYTAARCSPAHPTLLVALLGHGRCKWRCIQPVLSHQHHNASL